ncbi:MAG: DUF3467 domain-containing protein [Chitinophagaceae bacterium]|nr:DUF3467 domain-containing protein [Anaerolineae bacterium]
MQQPPNPNKPPQRQIRLELPGNLNASYANGAIINQTHSEIILDFVQVLPNDPRARVQARVVLTPANAKSFLQALKENLDIFEQKHGEITLPPKPISLAEQLFGNVRPEEGETTSDAPSDETIS